MTSGGGEPSHADALLRSPLMQSGQPELGAGHVAAAAACAVIDVSLLPFVKMLHLTRTNARGIKSASLHLQVL